MTPFIRICFQGFFFWLAYDLSRFPVIPLYAQKLGLSPQMIGLAVGASTLTGVIGKSISGGLSDLLGRRILMIVAAGVATTAPLFYFFVHGAEGLIFLRLFHGCATAVMGPVGRALVSDIVAAEKRGRGLSTYTAVTNTGTMAGRWLGGLLLFWGGFRFPFFASAVAGVVALLITFQWRKDRRHEADSQEAGSFRSVFGRVFEGLREVGSNRTILVTSLTEAIQFFVTGAIDAFLPIYAKMVVGLPDWKVGSLYALQMGATIISKPLLGWLSDKTGRRPQILVGYLIGGMVVWLLPWQNTFTVLGVLGVVYGLTYSLTTSATSALVTDVCEQKHYGAAHGVFGTIFDAGHAAGPITAGILIAAVGYRWTFAACTGVLIVASLLFGFLVRDETA